MPLVLGPAARAGFAYAIALGDLMLLVFANQVLMLRLLFQIGQLILARFHALLILGLDTFWSIADSRHSHHGRKPGANYTPASSRPCCNRRWTRSGLVVSV